MAFGKNRNPKIFSEINITPLTDIFLVLLIIMMVVAPSLQSTDNSQVDVPEINNGINLEDNKITVSVIKDGAMFVNGEKVTISALTDKLISLKGDSENPEVVVKADKNVKSSKIMDIMNAAQEAEYKKLIVAGEPLNKKEQNELVENNRENNI